ncbi:hypothetical protein QF117_13670 [Vibrio sp. YMD68]|uniref:hypothetical protein n=1 Tax=Vibrio sp. YMD68 TaxID=3042300 RepID=UPI00249AD9E5|nr:hypothetical protein [Vibrio sp. YMD68]WGW01820.1 hypothetical protein QF117_13670 [Vibrio sp. YMD68]
MAAQPLTKGRFAQIIITLTILVGVFTWRTITHSQIQFVDCEYQELCSFDVKNNALEANFSQGKLKLEFNTERVSVSTNLSPIEADEPFVWALPQTGQDPSIVLVVILKNNDTYQVNIKNFYPLGLPSVN